MECLSALLNDSIVGQHDRNRNMSTDAQQMSKGSTRLIQDFRLQTTAHPL